MQILYLISCNSNSDKAMDSKRSSFVESEDLVLRGDVKEEMVAPYHKYIVYWSELSVHDGCGNHVIVRESR